MNKPMLSLSLLDLRLLVWRSPGLAVLIGAFFLSAIALISTLSRVTETASPTDNGDTKTTAEQRNFRAILMERSALDAAQQLILDTATNHQLIVGRVDYAQEADPAGRFTVASMRLPVSGRYSDIRAFIESALAAQPALSLRHLNIQRETSAEANDINNPLSATLTLQLLLGERERP